MSKKKKWIKPRHGIIRNIAYLFMYPYARLRYGITVERLPKEKRGQYLILYNHQTPFDQFFVGMTVSGPVYYLASEDIFSNGALSSLMRYLVAPIPIKKQTTDAAAVIKCIRVAREGGTVAIAPEGNRTYSGKTEYINPAIASLARKLKLPIAFVKLEGGYGVQPRWSDVIRKGKMRSYVSRILEPEQYERLDNAELCKLICDELYVNEAKTDSLFVHKKSAEYLERAVYVCPYCGLSGFESRNDTVRCVKCDRKVKYLPTKELEGVGFDFPFRFMNDWYEYQCRFVENIDLSEYTDKPMYSDRADAFDVIVYKNKKLMKKDAEVFLYGDRIEIDGERLEFDNITAASVLGRNKLNIYHGGRIYQLKGNKRFNALKYVNMYYLYKNVSKGEDNGKFLGL